MEDNYGRKITYMRISVTDKCNLRCRYCMPLNGNCKKEHDEMMTEEELINLVEASTKLGIKKMFVPSVETTHKSQCEVVSCSRIDSTFREIFKKQSE